MTARDNWDKRSHQMLGTGTGLGGGQCGGGGGGCADCILDSVQRLYNGFLSLPPPPHFASWKIISSLLHTQHFQNGFIEIGFISHTTRPLKCTTEWFLVHQPSPQPTLEYFHHPEKKPCTLSGQRQSFHCPQALSATKLFLSTNVPVLDTSYQWNHTICGLLCLTSFIQCDVFKIHPLCGLYLYFIPFSDTTILHRVDRPHAVLPPIHC